MYDDKNTNIGGLGADRGEVGEQDKEGHTEEIEQSEKARDGQDAVSDERNENESESSSSLSSNYVSAYRGTSGLKKRKRRRVLKTSHYR